MQRNIVQSIRFNSTHPSSHAMIAPDSLCDEELQYAISFRQVRLTEREDAPPPGRFETTGSARLARTSRYQRQRGQTSSGIHQRGTAKARR